MSNSTEPLGVGVIGCGYWGPNLIRNFAGLRDSAVIRVADLNADRRAHIAEIYPQVEAVEDYREILRDPAIEAVAIATPVRTHHPLAKEAIEAGKHVFVEKPLCETVAETEDLIALAESAKRVLFVGHTFLYTAAVHEAKRVIDAGELGDILYISCRRLNLGLLQRDINVIQDLAPHDLSILNWALDQDPVSVAAMGSAHYQPDVEDVAVVTLQYPNNVVAYLHYSWLDPKKTREVFFVGSEKMLVYDDLEGQEKIRIYDKRVVKPDYYNTFGEFQFSYHYGDIHIPWLRGGEPLRAECQHFVDCVRTGARPRTGGVEGLRVVRILEAANQSLRQGGTPIELPPFAQPVAH